MSDKKKFSGKQLVKIVLVAGMFLGGTFLVISTYLGQTAFNAKYNENKKTIEQLTIDIDELKNREVPVKEEVIDVLVSAKKAGEAVATLQNEYVAIPVSTDSTDRKSVV